jgi:hypothetical protein
MSRRDQQVDLLLGLNVNQFLSLRLDDLLRQHEADAACGGILEIGHLRAQTKAG